MISEEILYLAKILELKAKQKGSLNLSGAFLSAFRGRGLEFKDVREYSPGDEVRHIDWNVSARLGGTYVKNFFEDRTINLVIVLDISRSMNFGSTNKTKLQVAMQVAALLLIIGQIYKYKVILIGFSSKVDLFLKLKSGQAEVIKALAQIESISKITGNSSNFDEVTHFIEKVVRKRGVLFFLSDFINLKDANAIARLRKKFKINLLHFYDEVEHNIQNLIFDSSLATEDLESGNIKAIHQGEKVFNIIDSNFPYEKMKIDINEFVLTDMLHYLNQQEARQVRH